jgi:hypothetical protein
VVLCLDLVLTSALVIFALVISDLVISTRIFYLSLGKPHLNCCGATFTVLTHLKLYFLTCEKPTKFYAFKIVAMEEEVFSLFCLDKPITTVKKSSDCALWHRTSP